MRSNVVAAVLVSAAVASAIGMRAPGHAQSPALTGVDVQRLLDAGRYEEAEATAHSLVDSIATSGPPLARADASDLLVKALVLNGKASADTTVTLARQTLDIKRTQLPRSDRRVATSLVNLGVVLGDKADHARAIALLEEAVALYTDAGVSVSTSLKLAEALDVLGVELTRNGRPGDAVVILERSLRLKEGGQASARDVATTLESLASALQFKGEYSRARTLLSRATSLHQSAGTDHPAYIQTLTLLGEQLWFEGNLSEARQASAQAVDLATRALRPDHPGIAWALRGLAATMLDMGYVAEARALQERALGIAQRSLGPNHHDMAFYLNGLAESNRLLGAYPAARTLYEQARAVVEATEGSNNSAVAGLIHNLALVDANLGDYASARQQQARATAIWERVLGRDHTFVATALIKLAAVEREQGAAAEALPLLERALAIRERKLGRAHREVALTLADLSATLIQLGQLQRAQVLATRALQILDTPEASDAPDLANALDLYGQLQMSRGENRTARQYLERSLKIKQTLYGSTHPTVAETQARLAQAMAATGERAAALEAAAAAETTGREHLRLMLQYLPERQSLNYAATRPRGLDLTLSLVADTPHAPALALDAVIRSRALVLDEMAVRRSTRDVFATSDPALSADLARARQRLANLVVRGPGELPPARYAALLEDARRDGERAERSLAERSADFNKTLQRTQIGLNDLQRSLPPATALVSFIRYRHTNAPRPSPAGLRPVPAVTSYLGFVLTASGPPVAIPLGSARTLDTLVADWRSSIAAEVSTRRDAGATAVSSRISGTALRRRVWDPLVTALNGASQVIIVPDGTLSLVPFAALPVQSSAYLVERGPVIHYISAERDLVALTAPARSPAQGLLAIGGPAFDDRTIFAPGPERASRTPLPSGQFSSTVRATPCESLQQLTFSKLDGARREVEELAKIWSLPSTNAARVLVGHEATERTFKQEASRYRVLHLATHGFFLGDTCDSPGGTRGTRAVGGLTTAASTRADAISRENPLLLSGLALAGANQRASARPDDDDGILTAEEVASLNLSGVEWAVLSACNTGLGAIASGEGVFGLRRAFQVAGAHTVIMSLWSVDDQGTRRWMRALYEGRFQRGLDTARAMREASLSVLRERRAKGLSTLPFYWAAFVAAGDWR